MSAGPFAGAALSPPTVADAGFRKCPFRSIITPPPGTGLGCSCSSSAGAWRMDCFRELISGSAGSAGPGASSPLLGSIWAFWAAGTAALSGAFVAVSGAWRTLFSIDRLLVWLTGGPPSVQWVQKATAVNRRNSRIMVGILVRWMQRVSAMATFRRRQAIPSPTDSLWPPDAERFGTVGRRSLDRHPVPGV